MPDLADYNARWLLAWSEKDVDALLRFYSKDVAYKDPQVPGGLTGQADLRAHLEKLFSSTPPTRYEADEIWPTDGGYCGRWYCTVSPPGGQLRRLRGFDLVVLDGEEIVLNEVYVHVLPDPPIARTGGLEAAESSAA